MEKGDTASAASAAALNASKPTGPALPRDSFARLCPHPYLLYGLDPPSTSDTGAGARPDPRRANGRAPMQARPIAVTTSGLSTPQGSAVVRIGDTTAVCGVRAETVLASDLTSPAGRLDDDDPTATLRDYDLIVPNVELATGCAPRFLPRTASTTAGLAQTLSTRLHAILHAPGLLPLDDLRIWHQPDGATTEAGGDAEMRDENDTAERTVIAYWILCVDVLFVSFDGSALAAAVAAAVAALRDTCLPRAVWDDDLGAIMCDRTAPPRRLSVAGLPVALSAASFTASKPARAWLLVDPDDSEERLCGEQLSVVIDCSHGPTQLLAVSKAGGIQTAEDEIQQLVLAAEERWRQFHAALEGAAEAGARPTRED